MQADCVGVRRSDCGRVKSCADDLPALGHIVEGVIRDEPTALIQDNVANVPTR
jgi:hypothetical protein